MAFDALETEFANAKLARSLSRRDDRRYFWRLLPAESDSCMRLASRYTASNAATVGTMKNYLNLSLAATYELDQGLTETMSTHRFLDMLGDPCGIYMFECYLVRMKEDVALYWFQFLQSVHPVIGFAQQSVRLGFDEIVDKFLRQPIPPRRESSHDNFNTAIQELNHEISVRVAPSPSSNGYLPKPKSKMSPMNHQRHPFMFKVEPRELEQMIAEHVNKRNTESYNPNEQLEMLANKLLVLFENCFFAHFLESVEFRRFIQLKEFAMRPVTVDDFATFRVMGRGAYGAVYAVEKLNTHRVYAWKEMNKRHLKQQRAIDVALNEVKILSELNSPFITGLRYCMQTSESLVLILDFCSGGDLSYHMKKKIPIQTAEGNAGNASETTLSPAVSKRRKKNPLPPDLLLLYAAEIILGIEHMHNRRIVYRDLKPANILLDAQGHIRISDLGLAKKFTDRKPTTSSLGGTPGYWAPEVLARQPYSQWVDWWSFAVFLYEGLSGMRPACRCIRGTSEWCPFIDSREQEDNAKKGGTLKLCVDFPEPFFSPEAKDLILKMLCAIPAQRLGYNGASDIKAHSFFRNVDWIAVGSRSIVPAFVPGANVHAVSVHEVGEVNKQSYKKVALDHKDHKMFSQFKYVNDRVVQEELVAVLHEENEKDSSRWTPFALIGRGNGVVSPKCCTIL